MASGVRAEKLPLAGGGNDWNDHVFAGGEMVAVRHIRASINSGAPFMRYLHKDNLGSISAITDQSAVVIEYLAYDAWGKRRFVNGTADPSNTITSSENRGFTGHEHLEEVALVHMNGRIYDPALARMMSADPFLQDPTNGQALNRYAYVINNPLAYTDPNGFFFKSIFRAIGNIVSNPRAIIAIAAAIAVPELGIAGKSLFWNGVIGGAVAGGIAGGDIKSVVTGGISGGIFAGVGDEISRVAKEAAKQGSKVVAYTALEKAAFHAAAGGVTSVIQGGDFKSGFLAAGFAKLAGPVIPDIGGIGNAIARATVGGIAAVAAGGRFENGAVTAAFAYLFNECLHGSKCSLWNPARYTDTIGDIEGAEVLADRAMNETREKFPNLIPHNNEGDAWRHARWNELMVRQIGPATAWVAGVGHEAKNIWDAIFDPGQSLSQTLLETRMDLNNNYAGRTSGMTANELLRQGKLTTLNFPIQDTPY